MGVRSRQPAGEAGKTGDRSKKGEKPNPGIENNNIY